MSQRIVLTDAVVGDDDLERPLLRAGRHLGADEFRRIQTWQDRRLDLLLAGEAGSAAIRDGLAVTGGNPGAGGLAGSPLGIAPGLAVGARGSVVSLPVSLQPVFEELIGERVDGVYLLVIERLPRVDVADAVDACTRDIPDARRDMRRVLLVRVRLVGPFTLPGFAAGTLPADAIQGGLAVAAAFVGQALPTRDPGTPEDAPSEVAPVDGVALAAIGVQGRQPRWTSMAGVRRLRDDPRGQVALLDAWSAAWPEVLTRVPRDAGEDQAAWVRRIESALAALSTTLPAAGELPLATFLPQWPALLAALRPGPGAPQPPPAPVTPWRFLGVDRISADLVCIPVNQLRSRIAAHVRRAPLRLDGDERVRLLLAVPDRDWRPDLLDHPEPSSALIGDLERLWRVAANAWRSWEVARQALGSADTLPVRWSGVIPGATLTAAEAALSLNAAEVTVLAPLTQAQPATPRALVAELVAAEMRRRGGRDLPEPWRDWENFGLDNEPLPHPVPSGLGSAVQRVLLERILDQRDDDIARRRADLDQAADVVLIQRNQLDLHATNLSALAGGTANDGSGLQVLRWTPFIEASAPRQANVGAAPAAAPVNVELPERETSPLIAALLERGGNKDVRRTAERRALSADRFTIEAPSLATLKQVTPEVYHRASIVAHIDGVLEETGKRLPWIREVMKEVPEDLRTDDPKAPADYEKLIRLSRHLIDNIAATENAHRGRERELRTLVAGRAALARRLDEVRQAESTQRNALPSLDRARLEADEDLRLARRLLAEDWSRVERLVLTRARILAHPHGLAYVRVASAEAALAPSDPLPLRWFEAGDVVPGCSGDHQPPPALAPFLDALWELPMSDWAVLARTPLVLAQPPQLTLALQRKQIRQAAPVMTAATSTRLLPLQRVLTTLPLMITALPSVGLAGMQVAAAQQLGIADALVLPSGPARRRLDQLRDDLEQAVGCLHAQAATLPPSVRLAWASAADDNRLRTEDASAWPGIGDAEEAARATTRTVVELVAWLNRQLAPHASTAGRTALRTLLRAVVIDVAHGDARTLITGRVVGTLVAVPGLRLRLDLDRAAPAGAVLELLNPQRQAIGRLRIADHDALGAVAEVIDVPRGLTIDATYAVSGRA